MTSALQLQPMWVYIIIITVLLHTNKRLFDLIVKWNFNFVSNTGNLLILYSWKGSLTHRHKL